VTANVGAQGHAREHEHAPRIAGDGPRPAHPLVARHQFRRARALANGGDGLREKLRVGVAQGRLEAVRQAFGEDAEQSLAPGVFRQLPR